MKVAGVAFALVLICASAFAEPFKATIFKNATRTSGRIVGGSAAQRYQFPYQISYQINNQHICGGSILNPQWVLTAGHCIVGSVNNTQVVAGMLHQGENHADVQIRGISKYFIHPKYPGGVAPNDIGLLRLATSLSWSAAVQPISLPQPNSEHTGITWVSGWGYLSSSSPITPTTLQQIQMGIMSFQQCAKNLITIAGSSSPLDTTMICVGGIDTGRETVCQGDSGGPLMQNGELLGVASWTITPCGTYGAPSVYTKVSRFMTWIKKTSQFENVR